MIACLDMYYWPESQDVFDALWAHCRDALREQGFAAPETLSALGETLADAAQKGDLSLGQVCGITFARANRKRPRYRALATFVEADGPHTDALGPAGVYTSVIIARDPAASLSRLLDRRLALNSWTSYSGWYALRHHLNQAGHDASLRHTVVSGGHRHSVAMVAAGDADWAAIDSISWGILRRIDPALTAQVHAVDRTMPVPGLPLVTSHSAPDAMVAVLKSALFGFAQLPQGKAKLARLGIADLAPIEAVDYDALLNHAGDC